tara:strand:+ start:1094 stop:1216 length:123 start_codon:yes stop_codon:yes gene_type:complete
MKVGITFSNFDFFHTGHVKMLEELIQETVLLDLTLIKKKY